MFKYLNKVVILIFIIAAVDAAPILNKNYELRQGDGSLVQVIISGDEYYQDVETPDGYSLIRDPVTGWICYAQLSKDNKQLLSTGIVYTGGTVSQKKTTDYLNKHLRIDKESVLEIRKQRISELNGESTETDFRSYDLSKKVSTKVDTIYGVTVLVDFPDTKSAIPRDSIVNFLNRTGYKGYGNNGSVRDYYYDISAGKLIYLQKVTNFVTAKNKKSFYDRTDNSGYDGSNELITEILTTLKNQGTFKFNQATINDRVVRAVNFLYAGSASAGWAQGLWPHSGATYFYSSGVIVGKYMIDDLGKSLTIGAFCHENGHMLCSWPDLYAYDDHSCGAGGYDIMSVTSETNPAPPNGFLRNMMGWMKITEISAGITGSVYKLPSNSDVAFFYSDNSKGSAQELFCIEAKRKTGRNATLPDEGLLIWHIDNAGDNTTLGINDFAAPEQADGKNELERKINYGASGDLFHAGYVTTFNDKTSPSALWHNGKASGIQITNISSVGDTMTFSLGNKITAAIKRNQFNAGYNNVSFSINRNVASYSVNVNNFDMLFSARLELYALDGKLIKSVVNDNLLKGHIYNVDLNNEMGKKSTLLSGRYLCKFTAGSYIASLPVVKY